MGYSLEQERNYRQIRLIASGLDTIKCLICGRLYRQIGSHVVQAHGLTARQYRELFDLEVKRGMLPPDLRELKASQAMSNGTVDNLKKGAKYRFVKGDTRAGKYTRSSVTVEKLRIQVKKIKKHDKAV